MRLVVAPNPLKGSLGSPAAAASIARGIRRVFPDAEVVQLPLADGGEGAVAALVSAHRGEFRQVMVTGPLGDPVQAVFGLIDDGATGVVELASASGLHLTAERGGDPLVASTRGFGELLEAVRRAGVGRIIAGIGGSATNDGGAGMAQALGYRLLNRSGLEIAPGGAALADLVRIDSSSLDPWWRSMEVQVASDVNNPLCGPQGATHVYGPQKGARPEVLEQLDSALSNFARVVEADLGMAVADIPGGGAAGGAGAGLVAFLGAQLRPGAALVADAAGLDRALIGADAVFTAEGRLDAQTAYGKGPAEVAKRARAAGVPVVILVGGLGLGWEAILDQGVSGVMTLAEGPAKLEDMQRDADRLLESAAARSCRLMAIWKS